MGYAACSLDYYGHGLNVWLQDPTASLAMSVAGLEFNKLGVPEIKAPMTMGRDPLTTTARGSGADMWTDVFHTRHMVRQSSLESTQFSYSAVHGRRDRVRRRRPAGRSGWRRTRRLGRSEEHHRCWGVSLGGIITGVLSGSEPGLSAVSPNAGGRDWATSAHAPSGGCSPGRHPPHPGTFVGCIPADDNQQVLPVGDDTDRGCPRRGSLEGPIHGVSSDSPSS